MINYNEDPVYDIRKLPVGGWNSSKISVQSYGRWLQFSDPVSCNVINSTLPINYSKKYKPPKKHTKAFSNQKRTDDSNSSLEDYIQSLNVSKEKSTMKERQKVFVPPIELSPERAAMIANQNINASSSAKTARPFIANTSKQSKRPNSPNELNEKHEKESLNTKIKTRSSENSIANHPSMHTVVFDEAEIPKTTRIIRKRKGEKTTGKFVGSYNSLHKSARSNERPQTVFKPRKTYLTDYNDDSNMIIYGYRSKTSCKNVK